MSQDNEAGATKDDKGQKIFIVIFGALLLFMIFAIANSDLVSVHFWPWGPAQFPNFLLLAGGFAAGALTTILLYRIAGRDAQSSWIYIALFCAAVMAVAAARVDQFSFVQAFLVIVLGSAALVATANAFSLLRQGEAIELQSNWGGLGGGLGGWRLSPATSLVLLALLFAGGATMASRSDKQTEGSQEVKERKGAKQGAQTAEGKKEQEKKEDMKKAKQPDVAPAPPKQSAPP